MHLVACLVAVALAAPPLRAPAERVPDPRTVMPEEPGEIADRPPPPEAVAAYRRGMKAVDEGRYTAALEAFARAYGIHPAPAINLAIGRTLLALENPQAAIRSARAYLDRTTDHRYDTEATRIIEQARRAMVREPVPPPPLRPTWKPLVISGSVLFGLGLSAVAGATIGLTATIEQRERELAAVLAGEGDPTSNEATRLDREISDLRVALIASATVSAAVALAGVIVLGVGVARRREQRVAVGTNGRGVSVSVRF